MNIIQMLRNTKVQISHITHLIHIYFYQHLGTCTICNILLHIISLFMDVFVAFFTYVLG